MVNYHSGSEENLYLTIFKTWSPAYELAISKMLSDEEAAKKLNASLKFMLILWRTIVLHIFSRSPFIFDLLEREESGIHAEEAVYIELKKCL